jgi:hypothetical protein
MMAIPTLKVLRMTERYRRPDVGHLDLEVTLSDAPTYARPWTVVVKAELAADTELIEFVCNENNRSLEHWVGKASAEAAAAAKVSILGLSTFDTDYVWSRPMT